LATNLPNSKKFIITKLGLVFTCALSILARKI